MPNQDDSDSEGVSHPRMTSRERKPYDDDDVLEKEEEQERLLLDAHAQLSTGQRLGGRKERNITQCNNKNGPRRTSRRQVSFDSDEDQELMYDAQQADRRREAESRVRSSFSESPSAWNREKIGVTPSRRTVSSLVFLLVLLYHTNKH